jgi:hypothetical protein
MPKGSHYVTRDSVIFMCISYIPLTVVKIVRARSLQLNRHLCETRNGIDFMKDV